MTSQKVKLLFLSDILYIMDSLKDSQVDRVINTLRKPEVRTEFTQAILTGFHEYFGEVFRQNPLPELIQQFKERKGMILPVGSLLRGTARVGSDFDSVLIYDGSITKSQHPNDTDFEGITMESGKFHPSRIPFWYWVARKFRDDPQLKRFIDERRILLQREIELSNRYRAERGMALRSFREEDVEKRLISVESQVFNIEELVVKTSELRVASVGNLKNYEGYMYRMGILVPQLLTTNLDYVVESEQNALLHHQQRFVQALADLEQQNPDFFQEVWTNLAHNFRSAVFFSSDNHLHMGSIDTQLQNYVEKSGRFSEDRVGHATGLLRGVRKQVTFPSFQSFKDKYLNKVA